MTARRPIIGLTTYAEPTRFGQREMRAALLPWAYVQAVQGAGGRPVLLPPLRHGDGAALPGGAQGLLDGLDGIVLSGGADLGPELYGQPPHETTSARPERDAAELALLRAALDADLPLLGICRGMQLLAVAAGGRLHQHLPEALNSTRHRPQAGGPMGEHPVRLAPGSRCHAILGDSLVVNSFHHQGVADAGTLTPVGWCPDDGLIEAVEIPGRSFALGVQWHEEEMPAPLLLAALVEAARRTALLRAATIGARQ